MMQQAKKLGFNAVKFQSFDESIVGQHPEKNRLLKSSITRDNIELINDTAKSVGIDQNGFVLHTPSIQDPGYPSSTPYQQRTLDSTALENDGFYL